MLNHYITMTYFEGGTLPCLKVVGNLPALPYLKVEGNLPAIDPLFDIFQSFGFLLYGTTRSHWPHLSAKKTIFFHQNLSFDSFETFCTKYLLDFDLIDPFFIVLRSVFFIVCWTPIPKLWWSTPPPPLPDIVSVHFNHFPYTEVCNTLRKRLLS